eukprot:gene12366-14126_t
MRRNRARIGGQSRSPLPYAPLRRTAKNRVEAVAVAVAVAVAETLRSGAAAAAAASAAASASGAPTAVAAATEETPDAEEESDTVPSSNSSLSSASFLPAQRLRGVPSTSLSTNLTVVTMTTSDSSLYSSAPRSSSMPPLPPTADISSPSGSDSPATSHASSATNASVASNTNGTSAPSYYHALASTSTSVTATVPGLLPQQTITKTVFKQKKVRLVDRIPIFVAKPGASFRLGERLPQSGVPFKLSARVEFYINKDEKVYKLRNLMN